MYSTKVETSSFWRSSATILVNRSSSWIPCYTGPVMMEAFYDRFWINNGLAIDCQVTYKRVGNALPSNDNQLRAYGRNSWVLTSLTFESSPSVVKMMALSRLATART